MSMLITSNPRLLCVLKEVYTDCLHDHLEDRWYHFWGEVFAALNAIAQEERKNTYLTVAHQRTFGEYIEPSIDGSPGGPSLGTRSDPNIQLVSPLRVEPRIRVKALSGPQTPVKKPAQFLGLGTDKRLKWVAPDITLYRHYLSTKDAYRREIKYGHFCVLNSLPVIACEIKPPVENSDDMNRKSFLNATNAEVSDTEAQAIEQLEYIAKAHTQAYASEDVKCIIICGGYYRLYDVSFNPDRSPQLRRRAGYDGVKFVFNKKNHEHAYGLNKDLVDLWFSIAKKKRTC